MTRSTVFLILLASFVAIAEEEWRSDSASASASVQIVEAMQVSQSDAGTDSGNNVTSPGQFQIIELDGGGSLIIGE